ncbi:MAG: alkyl sulfatase dimerization domain-containing protein, partial [Pseudomonadota bacterium]
LAHSMAIRAPEGWIIIDTGDTTQAAQEMRDKLAEAVGGPIDVAAILLTHWHYANGTGAWADDGVEIWGHEWLDSNRTATVGVGPLSGIFQARAISQFGVFHPADGPDSFPTKLGFKPDKFLGATSYQPPERLFANGTVDTFTIAGETVEVMPNRSDTTDSVGFYFPRLRALISNTMVMGWLFNVYSLRGGRFRDPDPYLEDSRRMESYNAAVLLDLHSAPAVGEEAVRDTIQRAGDQVRLMRDQSLRMFARGMDGREAAEVVNLPTSMRDGWEFYGQLESQVRQLYNGYLGWFGNDVYDINPLPLAEETRRMVVMMGGVDAVRSEAKNAAATEDIADWQWALKLTSMLLQLDPDDEAARNTRAIAARALGHRTASSNARGWYLTDALEMEGQLLALGIPVKIGQLRSLLGTPQRGELTAAGTGPNLGLLRVLIDPDLAADNRLSFTVQVDDDPDLWQVELRNGAILTEPATAELPDHVTISREDLADFILGAREPSPDTPLGMLNGMLDRSGFVFLSDSELETLKARMADLLLLGPGEQ